MHKQTLLLHFPFPPPLLGWALSLKLDMMDKLDKMDKPQQALHRPQSCGGLLWALTPSDGAASPTISKWTPPLSPTSSGNRSGKRTTPNRAGVDLEKRPSAAEAVAMLKRSGVPALEGVKMLRHMVGAAPRAWIRDFKIRGGRSVCLLSVVLQCSLCAYIACTAVPGTLRIISCTRHIRMYVLVRFCYAHEFVGSAHRIPDLFVLARALSYHVVQSTSTGPAPKYQRTQRVLPILRHSSSYDTASPFLDSRSWILGGNLNLTDYQISCHRSDGPGIVLSTAGISDFRIIQVGFSAHRQSVMALH